MAYTGIAKVQHYVPRFVLKQFGTGKKHKLFAFDKQTDRTFPTNVKNIAAESRFYDFEVEGHEVTIEPNLERIETLAKPVIASILDSDSLATQSAQDKATLSFFFAVQFLRTKWFREQFREMPRQLEAAIRRKEGKDADLSSIAHLIRIPDDNELALHTYSFIRNHGEDFAKEFANKVWVLLATDGRHPFMIGDHPIGLQNQIDMGPFGNLGLGVKGIEIYTPLTPRRALAMWCPSILASLRGQAQLYGATSYAHEIVRVVEAAMPLQYTPDNVMNFNSLQIAHAERFVFSSAEDFTLAKRMLAEYPVLRAGPRSTAH